MLNNNKVHNCIYCVYTFVFKLLHVKYMQIYKLFFILQLNCSKREIFKNANHERKLYSNNNI